MESLKDNPYFKKLIVIDCRLLSIATVFSLKEESKETVFIFDEFDKVPEKTKDVLLRFISERKSVILCNDQNYLLPVWFVSKCVTIEVLVKVENKLNSLQEAIKNNSAFNIEDEF